MSATIRELPLWNGAASLVLDGDAKRPSVHLQAASGGYLRLVCADEPLLWGRVDPGWYDVAIVRANRTLSVLPPIRAHEPARDLDGWTRHFAEQLRESPNTPLASGRQHLLASTNVLSSVQPLIEPHDLELLLEQTREFTFSWDDSRYVAILTTRPLSDADNGRVKMWRKRVRDKTLPPILTWWCHGLCAHVLLDGHDRLHAALLESVVPDVIVLADATPRAQSEIDARHQAAMDHAELVHPLPSIEQRAKIMNTILRVGFDPRADWKLATPGFPLDVAQWIDEVRGTSLDSPRA